MSAYPIDKYQKKASLDPTTHSCSFWGSWSLVTAVEAPRCTRRPVCCAGWGQKSCLSPAVTEHEVPLGDQNPAQLLPHSALVFVDQMNGQRLN